MDNNRYHALDSLRGVASFQVVLGHSLGALPILYWLVPQPKTAARTIGFYVANSPIQFFWNAGQAVIVFFVLSGFVLSLPYYSSNYTSDNRVSKYFRFAIKRVLRLYIPCFAIILISLLIGALVYNPDNVKLFGSWVRDMWDQKRTAKGIFDLFMLNAYFNDVDSALWTLPIELKLSLILPFYVYLQKRINWMWCLASVIGCAVFFHGFYHLKVQDVWGDFRLFYYFTFFALGSTICKYRAEIMNWANGLSLWQFLLMAVVALCIYTFQSTFWWLPIKLLDLLSKPANYIFSIAGGMFIIIALSNKAYGLLNSKVLLFLGKVSFSLYLIHQLVITIFASLFGKTVDHVVIVVFSVTLAIILSVYYRRFIELPAQSLGSKVAKLLVK